MSWIIKWLMGCGPLPPITRPINIYHWFYYCLDWKSKTEKNLFCTLNGVHIKFISAALNSWRNLAPNDINEVMPYTEHVHYCIYMHSTYPGLLSVIFLLERNSVVRLDMFPGQIRHVLGTWQVYISNKTYWILPQYWFKETISHLGRTCQMGASNVIKNRKQKTEIQRVKGN